MTIEIESLKSMTLPDLRKYAKALRAKIKEKGGPKSTDNEVPGLIEELDLVKSVISEKEIAEAKMTMLRNRVAEELKKTKPS